MSQDAEQQGLHCCICLEDSADDKWVALSQCGHMLHAHCLDSFCACRMADGKAPFCPKCRASIVIKPSQQAEKHLAKNYPISCRPELRQAAGRGIPRPCSQASDDAAGLAKLLRERAVQLAAATSEVDQLQDDLQREKLDRQAAEKMLSDRIDEMMAEVHAAKVAERVQRQEKSEWKRRHDDKFSTQATEISKLRSEVSRTRADLKVAESRLALLQQSAMPRDDVRETVSRLAGKKEQIAVREVEHIVNTKNALGVQVEKLQAEHNRDAAEMRSLQRQLREAQHDHVVSLASGPREQAAVSQAEARSHDSARRQAETASAEARFRAEEQAAARQQPTRGPNFGKVPRLPGFVPGWQQARAGDSGSRHAPQTAAAARPDSGSGHHPGNQRPEAHGELGHDTAATADGTAATRHGTAAETHAGAHASEAGAWQGSEEDDVLVVLSASDDEAAAAEDSDATEVPTDDDEDEEMELEDSGPAISTIFASADAAGGQPRPALQELQPAYDMPSYASSGFVRVSGRPSCSSALGAMHSLSRAGSFVTAPKHRISLCKPALKASVPWHARAKKQKEKAGRQSDLRMFLG